MRYWAAATALLLGPAAFGYSPYLLPHLWSGDALALAYQVRYAYLMSTLWLFGPAASYPAFATKLLLVIVLVGGLAAALLGLFSLAVRPRRH